MWIGRPKVTGWRRKRSGRRRRGVGRVGNGFLGATRYPKARPTTTETPSLATIWDRTTTTQLGLSEGLPIRVRWDILRRTVMDFTTWLGMYLSGVGIGMGRMQEVVIHADRHLGASVCCAAAVGTATLATRVAPIASAAARRVSTATSGFGV